MSARDREFEAATVGILERGHVSPERAREALEVVKEAVALLRGLDNDQIAALFGPEGGTA